MCKPELTWMCFAILLMFPVPTTLSFSFKPAMERAASRVPINLVTCFLNARNLRLIVILGLQFVQSLRTLNEAYVLSLSYKSGFGNNLSRMSCTIKATGGTS